MAKVKARKDGIMLDDRKGVEAWLDGMDGCTVVRGHARFEDPHTLRVGDELLRGDRIFLNVGGRAVVPDIPGLADVDFLTNVSILELDTLPAHLVIVGGSYIALEFAQMYRRFGARVTVVETGSAAGIARGRGRLGHHQGDPGGRRHRRRPRRRLTSGSAKRDNGFELTPGAGAAPIAGSHLLLAVGRRPNTDDLGLDAAGVQTDARGYIVVDDALKTNVDHIWAMGDCNGKGAFTHTSYNDFEIVAANLLDDDPRRVSDRITTYALYIDPPLGRAGMTVDQVRASGRQALVGKRPMTRVGRAVEKGETQGFMKVVVDADTQRDPGSGHPRRRRRRGHPLHSGRHVRQGALHHAVAHDAHPPDGQRADPHDAAGDVAAGVAGQAAAASADGCAPSLDPATRVRRRRAAEDRAVLLVRAPVAQPRRAGTEIACHTGGLDCAPDRHQRLLEAQQLAQVRGVVQQLAVGQIDEPQPGGSTPRDRSSATA